MAYQTLEVVESGSLTTVWLNRPDVRNAFNETTISELTAVFRTLDTNAQVRAIVLAARGSAFCAGADLNWMKKMAVYSHQENLEDAAALAAMLRTIHDCSKPVIARIQGDCYAGGMGLAAVCDIVVAVEEAHFCLSEVKLGLIPATISPYVIRAMGVQAARRYFLTAERITARQALQLGLVHELVPATALDTAVAGLLHALSKASPHAVTQAKRLVHDIGGVALTDALVTDTVARVAAIRASPDGREGMQAFLEKRQPSWAT